MWPSKGLLSHHGHTKEGHHVSVWGSHDPYYPHSHLDREVEEGMIKRCPNVKEKGKTKSFNNSFCFSNISFWSYTQTTIYHWFDPQTLKRKVWYFPTLEPGLSLNWKIKSDLTSLSNSKNKGLPLCLFQRAAKIFNLPVFSFLSILLIYLICMCLNIRVHVEIREHLAGSTLLYHVSSRDCMDSHHQV